MHLFSTPWKYQKTLWFSDIFREQKKGALGMNGLTRFIPMITTLHDIKIDLFLKINLTIGRLTTRKKYDIKEAFDITRAFF